MGFNTSVGGVFSIIFGNRKCGETRPNGDVLLKADLANVIDNLNARQGIA
jgi:hypothetical protein